MDNLACVNPQGQRRRISTPTKLKPRNARVVGSGTAAGVPLTAKMPVVSAPLAWLKVSEATFLQSNPKAARSMSV